MLDDRISNNVVSIASAAVIFLFAGNFIAFFIYKSYFSDAILRFVIYALYFTLLLVFVARKGGVKVNSIYFFWGGLVFLSIASGMVYGNLGAGVKTIFVSAFIFCVSLSLFKEGDGRYIYKTSLALYIVLFLSLWIDVFFPGTFSTTLGRAAGFYMNPNLAGGGFVLVGMYVFAFIRPYWISPFLISLGFGLLITMSRSTCLAFCLFVFVWLILNFNSLKERQSEIIRGLVPAFIIFFTLSMAFGAAYNSVKPFRVAFNFSLMDISQFIVVDKERIRIVEDQGGQGGFSIVSERGADLAEELIKNDSNTAEIEKSSSSNARAYLLQRGLEVYRASPWVGVGLEYAHQLAPHNTYLFFGLAFGAVGWLILPVFLILVVLNSSKKSFSIPFCVFLGVYSIFSHDVFIYQGLVTGLSLAVGACIARGKPELERII